MKHLDLFSGIGGFTIAAQAAGFTTIGFSEIDPYACKVLHKHWPDIKNYGDIGNVPNIHADLITGGPPCQPASCAGQRRGKEDDRWLWPQTLACVELNRPTFCLFENPTGILSLNGGVEFEGVLSKLEALGYAVQPIVIPAVAVDARHRRDRVWIIAHSGFERRRIQQVGSSERQNSPVFENDGEEEFMGNPNGFGRRTFRPGEMEAEPAIETRTAGKQPPPVANANKLHGKRSNNGSEKIRQEPRERPLGLQGNGDHGWSMWQPEPAIRRVADGIPNRSHRLRCLGNAIVPQVAEVILKSMVAIPPP